MKFVKYSAVLALVAFTLSLGAFAKDKSNNEGKFTLGDTAQVGSTQLKPGDYKAVWDGTGPDVQVQLLQGKHVMATTSAKLVDKSYAQDAVTLGPGSGGVKTLDEVDFGSRNKALVFGSATTAQN
jgi:hypothetical protein